MTRYLVDASNVIGSRPDGWWRDRKAADERLIAALARLPSGEDHYTVVLDRGGKSREHDGVTVLHATRPGRNAADDRIVDEVAQADDVDDLVIVTGDRELRRRVEERGARVTSARRFRDELDF